MGYSHYYEYAVMTASQFETIVADIETLRGSAHARLGVRNESACDYAGLSYEMNGVGVDSYELFSVIGGDMRELRPAFRNPNYHCCKTLRKPYDAIVGAGLISMKYHMGGDVELGPGGVLEEPDWDRAFRLYHETFLHRPPPPIPFFKVWEGGE